MHKYSIEISILVMMIHRRDCGFCTTSLLLVFNIKFNGEFFSNASASENLYYTSNTTRNIQKVNTPDVLFQ